MVSLQLYFELWEEQSSTLLLIQGIVAGPLVMDGVNSNVFLLPWSSVRKSREWRILQERHQGRERELKRRSSLLERKSQKTQDQINWEKRQRKKSWVWRTQNRIRQRWRLTKMKLIPKTRDRISGRDGDIETETWRRRAVETEKLVNNNSHQYLHMFEILDRSWLCSNFFCDTTVSSTEFEEPQSVVVNRELALPFSLCCLSLLSHLNNRLYTLSYIEWVQVRTF